MTAIIEVQGLRKTYRRLRGGTIVALDGLDLTVPEGGVFGFLGPNGAGKTTAIRCLVGLIRPTAGDVRVLGAPVPSALPSVISNIGAIVETPALFPNFSGRRNLRLMARTAGIGYDKVEHVLAEVGLTERAGQTVKGYSLGMRQRLGLAAALLKDPKLLILDEPANGLDPSGIRAMRDLIRRMGDEGRTVFLSSHLLSEIEQTCDRVALLTKGRCIASGSVGEILKLGQQAGGHIVQVPDPRAAADVLAAAGMSATLQGSELLVATGEHGPAHINEVLGRNGIWLSGLRPQSRTLEDVFLELTAGGSLGEER